MERGVPRQLALRVIVLALMAGFAVACNEQRSTNNRPELVLGAVLPMSGETADWGRAAYRGVELATRKLNGEGVPVRLLPPEDNRGDSRESADAVRRLVGVHAASAIIGPITSTNTAAAAKIADELQIPLVTPSATAAAITKDSNYAFRACYVDDFQGRILAAFAAKDLNARRVAVVMDPSDPYSAGLAKIFEEEFAADGRTVNRVMISMKDREFGPQIVSIRTTVKPDIIFMPANYPEVAAFLRQARRSGLAQPVLTGDAAHSPELFELAGPAANAVYVTSHFATDSTDPVVTQFVQDFTKAFGEAPNVAAALSFDAAMMVGRAFASRGAGEPLRDAIARTKNLTGVTGTITLDSDRNPIKTVVVLKTELGSFKFVRSVA